MRRLLIVLLLLACLWGTSPAQPAWALPPLPASFYGSVTIDGANVPPGTTVSAWINGVPYAASLVVSAGGSVAYGLNVPGDDPSTPAIDGGRQGDVIAFKIDGGPAQETGLWQSGTNTHRDLTRRVAGVPAIITLEAAQDTLVVGGAAAAAITATVKDALGNPLSQVALAGQIAPAELGALSRFGLTDAAGQAAATWAPGTLAGSGTLGAGNGTVTGTLAITLANPLPTVAQLDPASRLKGSAAFSLTVSGADLMPGATVVWNGQPRPTVRLDGQTLRAAIPRADVAAAGSVSVAVTNPAPGGGQSGSLSFSIIPIQPAAYLPIIRR